MSILDSASAIARARVSIGGSIGVGLCLENVYNWYGNVQSIGPGAGRYDRAFRAWEYAEYKIPGIPEPAAGLPIHYGIDTPRTDRNADKGDIGLSIGNGFGIFSDSPNGRTGIMSIAARGAQIRRNYLGTSYDFLGHITSVGLDILNSKKPSVTTTITRKADPMATILITTESGQYLSLDGAVTPFYRPQDASDFQKKNAGKFTLLSLTDATAKNLIGK